MAAELEVLTLNLWGLPWPAARERRARKQRFAEHLEQRAYDLVGIQELWWPWRRSLRVGSLVLPPTRRDSGLALAGRLPVREVRAEHFRAGRGVDRLKRKGFLRARAQAPTGEALAVCVVHLQAARRHAAARARQVDELLERLSGEREPIVLMGDFNFHDGCPEDGRSAASLRSAGFADAALALARAEPTWHAPSNPYVPRREAQRFDRVYLRDGGGLRLRPLAAEVLRMAPRPVSDHHPLRVRVRVSASASP